MYAINKKTLEKTKVLKKNIPYSYTRNKYSMNSMSK